jgi:hypothetical protein
MGAQVEDAKQGIFELLDEMAAEQNEIAREISHFPGAE